MISPDQNESSPAAEPNPAQGGAPAPSQASLFARLGRAIALYSSLGAAATVGGIKVAEIRSREESVRVYGTIDAPKFTVHGVAGQDAIRSLDALLQERDRVPHSVPIAGERVEDLAPEYEKTFGYLRTILEKHTPSDAELEAWRGRFGSNRSGAILTAIDFEIEYPQHASTCEALRALGESAECAALQLDTFALTRELEEIAFTLGFSSFHAGPDEADAAPSGVSSVDYSKAIFRRVTGHDLPPEVSILRRDIAEAGVAGTAESLVQTIVVEPSSFGQEVSTLCHEMGHLIARPGEELILKDGFFSAVFFSDPHPRIEAVLEEASAYAFERVCVAAIPDDGVRKAAAGAFECQLLNQSKLFFNGESDIHYEAGVLADAAVRVLGDPERAFAYLSQTREVSPEILRAIETTRERWQALPSGRCRRAAADLREIRERVDAIRVKVDPAFGR